MVSILCKKYSSMAKECHAFDSHKTTLEIFEFLYTATTFRSWLHDQCYPVTVYCLSLFTFQGPYISNQLRLLSAAEIKFLDLRPLQSSVMIANPLHTAPKGLRFRCRPHRSDFYILSRCSCFVNHLLKFLFRRLAIVVRRKTPSLFAVKQRRCPP